jgi:hypothetical protein
MTSMEVRRTFLTPCYTWESEGIGNVPKKNNIKSETKIELLYYSHIKMEVLLQA